MGAVFETEMSVAGESLRAWIRTDLFDAEALVVPPVPGRLMGRAKVPVGMLCPAGRSLKPLPVLLILRRSRVVTG